MFGCLAPGALGVVFFLARRRVHFLFSVFAACGVCCHSVYTRSYAALCGLASSASPVWLCTFGIGCRHSGLIVEYGFLVVAFRDSCILSLVFYWWCDPEEQNDVDFVVSEGINLSWFLWRGCPGGVFGAANSCGFVARGLLFIRTYASARLLSPCSRAQLLVHVFLICARAWSIEW